MAGYHPQLVLLPVMLMPSLWGQTNRTMSLVLGFTVKSAQYLIVLVEQRS